MYQSSSVRHLIMSKPLTAPTLCEDNVLSNPGGSTDNSDHTTQDWHRNANPLRAWFMTVKPTLAVAGSSFG